MWLKGCPRCRGDMYRDWDVVGSYRQCIQCGYTLYESPHGPSRVLRTAT